MVFEHKYYPSSGESVYIIEIRFPLYHMEKIAQVSDSA